jgi:peptide/nickel transport system substrate-binding protein
MKEEYLKKQARWLSEGQIDRRQFIRAAIATGLAVPSALTLANECARGHTKQGRQNCVSARSYGSTTDTLNCRRHPKTA